MLLNRDSEASKKAEQPRDLSLPRGSKSCSGATRGRYIRCLQDPLKQSAYFIGGIFRPGMSAPLKHQEIMQV